VGEILNLYHMCKTFNQLPRAGGVLDQPDKLMVFFQVINAAESERENRQTEKRRREAAKHAGNSA
jgi:hypothetical protein